MRVCARVRETSTCTCSCVHVHVHVHVHVACACACGMCMCVCVRQRETEARRGEAYGSRQPVDAIVVPSSGASVELEFGGAHAAYERKVVLSGADWMVDWERRRGEVRGQVGGGRCGERWEVRGER